ncbi:hypothetical protein ARMGADRAFT_594679 [Armillaria gallica]|uniref:Uncharacterized protein n=1 Tax=Armillaria gallica TaxID=47427 RepID=A0A2H3CPL2_ARMGA|nr:hypothetical protein ARMGADRAFT_594679 [Armillaria gallica]
MTVANGDRASQSFHFFQRTTMAVHRFGVLLEHGAVSPTPSGSVVITDVDGKNLGAPTNITLPILPYRRTLGWHTGTSTLITKPGRSQSNPRADR